MPRTRTKLHGSRCMPSRPCVCIYRINMLRSLTNPGSLVSTVLYDGCKLSTWPGLLPWLPVCCRPQGVMSTETRHAIIVQHCSACRPLHRMPRHPGTAMHRCSCPGHLVMLQSYQVILPHSQWCTAWRHALAGAVWHLPGNLT